MHAKGQVFHFDADWKHGKEKLLSALRRGIPKSIQVVSLKLVSDNFHARYGTKGKRYVYYLYEGYALPTEDRYCWSIGDYKLDIKEMKKAAKVLIGKHDFSAFAGKSKGEVGGEVVKKILRLDIIKRGARVKIVTEGSGYLYKMVRSFVGALVDVGLGKLSCEELEGILKSRLRTQAVVTAPAKGLFLEKVFY
ncbi:MAG: tRNA pseudouridine(38-40) synthase TruA [Verrucomicrobia bacterium]|nr:MAG: tRNA pseudouridine(38-40) synthase TruA [Verrucomicrobiota bacterium]